MRSRKACRRNSSCLPLNDWIRRLTIALNRLTDCDTGGRSIRLARTALITDLVIPPEEGKALDTGAEIDKLDPERLFLLAVGGPGDAKRNNSEWGKRGAIG